MTLTTRKPTGVVPYPLILVEGGEKVGKGWCAGVLSASPKVGRTVVIDLNEGAWDEYGQIDGARFEIAEHDGTWAALMGMVADAKAEAVADREAGKPPSGTCSRTGPRSGPARQRPTGRSWSATRTPRSRSP